MRPTKECSWQFWMPGARIIHDHRARTKHGLTISGHAAGVQTVRREKFLDHLEVATFGDIQIEFDVLTAGSTASGERSVVSSHRIDAGLPDQRCAAMQEILDNQCGINVASKRTRREIEQHPILLVDSARPAIDEADIV